MSTDHSIDGDGDSFSEPIDVPGTATAPTILGEEALKEVDNSMTKDSIAAAADYLKKLGYEVDNGGPLYYVSLARFMMTLSEGEKKVAMTPEGLVLIMRARLNKKLNVEAPKGVPLWVYPVAAIGVAFALWQFKKSK